MIPLVTLPCSWEPLLLHKPTTGWHPERASLHDSAGGNKPVGFLVTFDLAWPFYSRASFVFLVMIFGWMLPWSYPRWLLLALDLSNRDRIEDIADRRQLSNHTVLYFSNQALLISDGDATTFTRRFRHWSHPLLLLG
jgi:hypothetical protein